MPNSLYRDDVIGRVRAAIARYAYSAGVNHSGLQGKIREIAIQDLILPLMPDRIRCGTGKVIDADEMQSGEMDVILYSNAVLSPVLFDQTLGLFPYEACLSCIQVKSKINSTEWKNAVKNLHSLDALKMTSGVLDEYGRGTGFTNPPTERAVFAFDSDISGASKTELERYKEAEESRCQVDGITEFFSHHQLNILCVVGRGCWWWERDDCGKAIWKCQQHTNTHDEVIKFLTLLRMRTMGCLRGRGEPDLGRYLLP